MAGSKSLLLKIAADVAGLKSGVRQSVSELDKLGKAGHQAGELLRKALGVASVGAAVALGTELFNIGVESEAMGLRYRAVFGENTAALDQWVADNRQAFGMAVDDMEGLVAQVGNQLTPLGLTATQAGETATKILELAAAWSVWSGGQLSSQQAAEALTKGVLGQTRGLQELGMNAAAVRLIEDDLATTMDTDGAPAADLLRDSMERLNRITEQSGPAMQVYEQAMQGGAGAQRAAQTAINEFKDTLGALVVQVAPAVEALSTLLGAVGGLISGMDSAASGSGPALIGALGGLAIAGPAGAAIGALGMGIASAFGPSKIDNILALRDALLQAIAAGEDTSGIEQQLRNMGASIDELDIARLKEELPGALDAVREALDNLTGPFREVEEGSDDTARATDTMRRRLEEATRAAEGERTALQDLADQQRAAIDPAFALLKSVQDIKQAQDDFNQAVREGDLAGQQKALEDAALAQLDYNTAVNQLDTTQSAAALQTLLSQAGFTRAEIDTLIAKIQQYNRTPLNSKSAVITLHEQRVTDRPGGTTVLGGGRQHGGPVSRDRPYVVGEAGPELFVPNTAGKVVPDSARPRGLGLDRPLQVHVHVDVDGREIARAVVQPVSEELDRYRRSRS